MKTRTVGKVFVAILGVILLQTGCASDKEAQSDVDRREVGGYATITATVEAVNLETREITLSDPNGVGTTFTVDNQVKRLGEIKAGDKIRIEYYISLASEIREPTEEERDDPLTVLEGMAKAPSDTSPGAGGLRQIRAVVTVKDIDLERNLVTIKGPMGRYLTLRPLYPERLKLVKVDDTVIVTYTEALAVSVEKVEE